MEIDVQEIMEIFRKSMMLAEAEAAAEKWNREYMTVKKD